MRLNLTIVASKLTRFKVGRASLGSPFEYPIKGAAIWDGSEDAPADALLVCLGASVTAPVKERRQVLAIGDIDPELVDRCDYVCLEGEPSLLEVLSEVLSIFSDLSDWDMRLQEAATEAHPQRKMLEVASEQIANDLALYDSQAFMLCHVAHPSSSLGDCYPDVDMNFVPQEQVIALFESTEWKRISSSRLPTVLTAGIGPVDSLYTNIFMEGSVLARLSVDATVNPIDPPMRSFAWHVSRRLKQALTRIDARASSAFAEKLFTDLLVNGEKFDASHANVLAQLGWSEHDTYGLIVIEPVHGTIGQQSSLQIIHALKQHYPQSITFDARNSIVSVYNLSVEPHTESQFDSLTKDFEALIEHNDFVCGDCRYFRDFKALRTQHEKAMLALRYGKELEPDRRFHQFEDLAPQILVSNAPGNIPASEYSPEALRRLAEYDRLNETELLETLRVYLRSGLNATETARELFVHKTTFYYRLRRIEEETGIDLSDYHTRLYLELMFEMLTPGELRRL